MTKFYIKGREAILRVRTDKNGVVSFGTSSSQPALSEPSCWHSARALVVQLRPPWVRDHRDRNSGYRRYRLTKWGHWEFSIPRFSFEAAMVYISILQVPLLLYVAMTDVAIRTISNRDLRGNCGHRNHQPINQSTATRRVARRRSDCLFLLLLTMHSRGWVGGGDVKLLVALAIGLSLTQLMQLLTVMALAGVGLAMAHMVLRLSHRRL